MAGIATIIIGFAIIIFVVGLYIYWIATAPNIYPDTNAFTPPIRSGRKVYLINAERFEQRAPSYLGLTTTSTGTVLFKFFSNPSPETIWIWRDNKDQCTKLDTIDGYGCNADYISFTDGVTYTCNTKGTNTPCDPNYPGFYVCSYCYNDNGKGQTGSGQTALYTSISLSNDSTGYYLGHNYQVQGNGDWEGYWTTYPDLNPSTQQYIYTFLEDGTPANTNAIFNFAVRFKNLPVDPGNAGNNFPAYLGNTSIDGGVQMQTDQGESDSSSYFIQLVPIS